MKNYKVEEHKGQSKEARSADKSGLVSFLMIGERGLSSCRGIDVKYLVDISYI